MNKPLLLTFEYPPQIGGVGKYLEAEVNNFPGGVKVVDANRLIWRFWPKWLSLLWRVGGIRKKGGCDYLWISHVLPIGYIAFVWKVLFKIKYRVYLHGLDLARPRKSAWKKFWIKKILLSANEIVVNSSATAQLLSHYGIGQQRARIQHPRLEPIDATRYQAAGRQLRERYNIGDKPILLTISRLVKRKGIDLVIQALPEIWRQIPNLVYAIIGEGEERERLAVIASEALAERGNLNNAPSNDKIASPRKCEDRNEKIIFTGSVSDEEKYGWLSACDCFILTPIDDPNDFEGYGIVYKEARMFGKPVIGSRVGGVPEAIGDNGTLIEPNNSKAISDAVIKILRGKSENQKIRKKTPRFRNSEIPKFRSHGFHHNSSL